MIFTKIMLQLWAECFSISRINLVPSAGRFHNPWLDHHSMGFPITDVNIICVLEKIEATDK